MIMFIALTLTTWFTLTLVDHVEDRLFRKED
jgi:hypothetical protein